MTPAELSDFVRPRVTLDVATDPEIQTLPVLVDFHAKRNSEHLFCLQVERDDRVTSVTFKKLQRAILRCQTWLQEQSTDIHPPKVNADGHREKCAPIAILMESHVGLAIHILACMGIGIPVLLLSARLGAPAVRHLIGETGVKLVLVSPRLQRLAVEAFPATEGRGTNGGEGDGDPVVRLAASYEQLLEEGHAANPTTCVAHPDHYVSEEDRQVIILHSSGTTGLPKPIPCSHRYFLGYATCHDFKSNRVARGLTISTMPFFHVSNFDKIQAPERCIDCAEQGFGLVCVCMSLAVGKTICIPPPSTIPTGSSIASLVQKLGAKALLTVPSILEEIESLPDNRGHKALQELDFVAFGGGLLKQSTGERLLAAGVKLIAQYGATEAGAMTTFFVPEPGYDWRRLRLRSDTLKPLEVRLDPVAMGAVQPSVLRSGANGSSAEQRYAYKLSMKPFGWRERFELQDVIVTQRECSSDSDIGVLDFTLAGRTDDLICLATGEKVRPTMLESLLKQQEGVREAVAFGDQQFELGVIVEPTEVIEADDLEKFKASIWPAIVEAGRQMDAHAGIVSTDTVLVVGPNALPRSDKGSVLRNTVAQKFAAQIAQVYRNREAGVIIAPALDLSSPSSSIRALVSEATKWQTSDSGWLDHDDFFARGMDSLQATQLRRLLAASVRATQNASPVAAGHIVPPDQIIADFVYANPSVSRLVEAVTLKRMGVSRLASEMELIEELVDKHSGTSHRSQKNVVVLTGATGSLGSFVLQRLLEDESVGRIVCLNRSRVGDPIEAQKQAMKARDISVNDDAWAKVEIHQTSTAASLLGLGEAQYERLATETTHVVHIAWPMNFKMGLESFDASFKSLQNLIQLARKAHFYHPGTKPRVLFISSISTVGNYPLLQGESVVPEIPVAEAGWTLGLGYGKAKLVCEKIIERAAQDYSEIETGSIRVGQIAGASNGYWNVSEHFVAICASSQKIGKFPDLRGVSS